MTDKLRILHYGLWMAHPLLQSGIAVIMYRRGLHKKFKYFFAYILSQILTFAVIFPARDHYNVYFYLYWISNAVSVVLGFEVIHEVFLDVFRPFHTLRDLGTILFKWAGLVMLLVAGVVSVSTRASNLAPWAQGIVTAQRCVRIIQVGMVLFLLFFARYVGVSRRQQSFGIALGFGGFAVIELALIASWAGEHLGTTPVYLINMFAYNVTLVVWLVYAWMKSPVRDVSTSLLQPQRWEESLSGIHNHPLPADSLIPMFEGMVDRALSRTHSVPSLPSSEPRTTPADAPLSVRAAAAGGEPGPATS